MKTHVDHVRTGQGSKRMKWVPTIGIVALLLRPSLPAFAQGAGIEWDILSQEAVSLYQKGQYDRAVTVAKKRWRSQRRVSGKIIPMWPQA